MASVFTRTDGLNFSGTVGTKAHQGHDTQDVEEDGLDVSVDVRPEVGPERPEDDDDGDHHRQKLPGVDQDRGRNHALAPKEAWNGFWAWLNYS